MKTFVTERARKKGPVKAIADNSLDSLHFLCFGLSNYKKASLNGAAAGPDGQDVSTGTNRMELYYKDLISKDASLEKLVDDLVLVVQGVDELAAAAGAALDKGRTEELASALQRIKQGCKRIEVQAMATARASDKVFRRYPYASAGVAFGLGVLCAMLLKRNRDS